MREQGEGGNYFFPTLVFESKTIDHNSGRHAKNQGEISKNEVRRPPPFVWKCGHSPLNQVLSTISRFYFVSKCWNLFYFPIRT